MVFQKEKEHRYKDRCGFTATITESKKGYHLNVLNSAGKTVKAGNYNTFRDAEIGLGGFTSNLWQRVL